MSISSPDRRGFTIVELLVVISIITILISILLPSLRDARDLAQVTQCGARQREVGIGLASYAVEWKDYPTPEGQPGYDSTIMDKSQAFSRYVTGWNYTGTANEIYMQSYGAWWVGAVTGDQYWYLNKGFQCTVVHPFQATPWAAFQGRDNPAYFSSYGLLCSTIQGQTYSDPNQTRGYLSPWFVYMSPVSNSQYVNPDWWDDCMAANDLGTMTFAGTDNSRFILPPAGYIVGPSYEQQARRAQLTCPAVTNFTNGSTRSCFEPHGHNDYTGNQNWRAPLNPEAKNYLFTDGSVTYIKH